ncbi:DNA adenine methylase [Volucribacter psittacicida]|uniref:site-specific DNA-methyltransferase (adenine-specific) n=1 Tax=Volucribacter psittacicida TaxID=203482 RepID=A0A4R1GC83_9PAST|nr:DNA adenine methylase [Volucribacter psittacicida]TCK01922.1 DNA adenine methylase [Volucribacter psittacicida]
MHYTPLRYPGGKSKFASTIKRIIEKNNLTGHYIEPYAGGAGVALDVLFSGYCTDIHINDFDLAIYHFWKSITEQTEDFIRLVNDTKVTIDEWHKQKILLKQYDLSPLKHGFAAFFLNRTNRSGILKAGVIGGLKQTGNYKIDCRFNKSDLIKRIEKIGNMAKHIHVSNHDTEIWLSTIDKQVPDNSLIYLDPPYYEKGQGLYRNFYKHNDHAAICHKLANVKTPWIVSYDNNLNIKEIYQQYRQAEYQLNYSANKKMKATEIIIYSDNLLL